MKVSILFFCLAAIIISCYPSMQQKERIFQKSKFDKQIVSDFPKYEAFAQVILNHWAEIIDYRNKKNFVNEIDSNGRLTKTEWREKCFEFFKTNSDYDIHNVPENLFQQLDSLWKTIGEPQFKVCDAWKTATLTIDLRCDEKKKKILECHTLFWHFGDFESPYICDFEKDTVLSNECTYTVGVCEDFGGW